MKASIDPALPVLKNTGSVARGRCSERKALKHFLSQDYQLISQNKKIAGVEVDLLLEKNHLFVVEVKTLRHFDEAHFRISKKQLNRLLFVRQWLQEINNRSVVLKVAFVVGDEVWVVAAEDLCGGGF